MRLKGKIDLSRIPSHIAIIMDGNGRWAQKWGLSKKAGHKAGAEALEKISQNAMDLGIKHLTVYAFSTENWNRSEEEVKDLMDLLRSYLQSHINKAEKDNIKIDIIGDTLRLDSDIQEKIISLENLTRNKTGIDLHIALNYGGRDEIIRVTKKIVNKILRKQIRPDDINEKLINDILDTKNIPDPELLIRTSGEKRLSNFLLWQSAYSELVFSDKLWPDFKEKDLHNAILEYQNRDRRFGGR